MGHEHFIHLAGIDIVAAHQCHVFLAVHDEEKAVLVHIRDVAGIKPSIPQRIFCLLRLVPVADHDLRAADDEFSQLSGGHELCARFRVDDAGVRIRQRHADGGILGQFNGVEMRDGRGLGETIAFHDAGTGDLLKPFKNVIRQRGGAGHADLYGCEIVFFQRFLLQE